ncbi:hypothetical protein ABIA39_007535 [Nocardia sp. GAS34]|uniref:hypothetical protein n=1 Tax=unclassified Nocardia TaxID=2637762 RepID=UPI003D1FC0BE
MSELDRIATRVADIPPEQADLLRQLHTLAGRSAELHQQLTRTGADLRSIAAARTENDRRWALTEVRARTAGVPRGWIAQAVQQGRRGSEWPDGQLLAKPLDLMQSRSRMRLVLDVRYLTHMAAMIAVRGRSTALGALPDPATGMADQITRNMQALWTRATETGRTITMSRRDRNRIWDLDRYPWKGTINELLHLAPHEIELLWEHYAAGTIAESARESLKRHRHDRLPAVPPPGPDVDTSAVDVGVDDFLAHANGALNAAAEQRSPETATIGAAITDVLPDPDTDRTWAPEPTDPGLTTQNPWPHDRGPGP